MSRLDIRALTVKAPWGDAIVDGHKPIENRSHGFPRWYRGRVLIHLSQQWSNTGLVDERIDRAYPGLYKPVMVDRARDALGCIIGHARLVDAHFDIGCCRPWGEGVYTEAGGRRQANLVHLRFERPVRYAVPIPARGALGLWRPSANLVTLAETQAAA